MDEDGYSPVELDESSATPLALSEQPGTSEQVVQLTEAALLSIKEDANKLKLFKDQVAVELEEARRRNDFESGILFCRLESKCESFMSELEKRRALSTVASRVASVDFEIQNKLIHGFDLELFKQRVLDLFQWYSDKNVRETYFAPYFPMVQSSGMGKTKLLWELREWVNKNSNAVFNDSVCVCQTIYCAEPGTSEVEIGEGHTFSCQLEMSMSTDIKQIRDNVRTQLDAILAGCEASLNETPAFSKQGSFKRKQAASNKKPPSSGEKQAFVKNQKLASGKKAPSSIERRIILLFDESQRLLTSGHDGLAFRTARRWLRIKRKAQVVAVFTGTTSRLTNFFKELPETADSRNPSDEFCDKIKISRFLFGPFWNLCTIGLLATSKKSHVRTAQFKSEYEIAIPYGRPLFAVMRDEGKLDFVQEFAVLRRMLLNNTATWDGSLESCVSILGTRLQLGQTTLNLASDLVAKGYAVLSDYAAPKDAEDTGSAFIFFPTDPVCARLAMALMDETWIAELDNLVVSGRDKKFWVRQIAQIFATGLCRPSQGDLGEIAAAAYLLFCGDILRRRFSAAYTTLSVSLITFFDCLINPGHFAETMTEPHAKKAKSRKVTTRAHLNFIQVTRNYIRFGLDDFYQEQFLEDLYLSGSAFYTFPSFPTFDLMASIKLSPATVKQARYVPFFVSISTPKEVGTQTDALNRMNEAMKGKGGLGLRVVFDRSEDGVIAQEKSDTFDDQDVDDLIAGRAVLKMLVVPRDDPFGITEMLSKAILCGTEKSEVYSSHSFLFRHSLTEYPSQNLLRKTTNNADVSTYMEAMREKLWNVRN